MSSVFATRRPPTTSTCPSVEDVRTQVGKPGAYTFEPVDDELAAHTREELRKVYDVAYETYTSLVEAGVARELARSVLPVGAYTEFYWTVNARSLMNFVSLRAAETAQREIRRYALAVEAFLAREMPVTYAAFIGERPERALGRLDSARLSRRGSVEAVAARRRQVERVRDGLVEASSPRPRAAPRSRSAGSSAIPDVRAAPAVRSSRR